MSNLFHKVNDDFELIIHNDDGPVSIGFQGVIKGKMDGVTGGSFSIATDQWFHLSEEGTRKLAVKLDRVIATFDSESTSDDEGYDDDILEGRV